MFSPLLLRKRPTYGQQKFGTSRSHSVLPVRDALTLLLIVESVSYLGSIVCVESLSGYV